MTTQVRDSVFETNSSSTHSLTMGAGEVFDRAFPKAMLRNRDIKVELGQYGWDWARYYEPISKLSYLLTQFHGDPKLTARICETVEKATGCPVSITVPDFHYIDHQSVGVGAKLARSPESLIAFLFDGTACIQTGNDNSTCGEFIRTDTGAQEAFHTHRYADAPNHEGRFTLEFVKYFDEVTFRSGGFEVSASDSEHDWKLRAAIDDALTGCVCVGGTVSGKDGAGRYAHPNAGRDIVLMWMSELGRSDEPTGATVKLFRHAEIALPEGAKIRPRSAFDVIDDPYSARFNLEFAASEQTIEAVKQAVLDLASANNRIPAP